MFAKVEEEIEFDLKARGDSKYFPGDNHITWEEWRQGRQYCERSSKQKEENNLKAKQYTSVDYLNNKLAGIVDFKTNAISLYNLWSYLSGFYFTIDYKYLDITCSFSGSQKNRAR